MTQPGSASVPSSPTSPPPDRQRATQLLKDRSATLVALPAADLLRPRISWDHALTLTGRLEALWRKHVTGAGPLNAEAWARSQGDLAELGPAALAYFAAQDVIERDAPEAKVARRAELRTKVRGHDKLLGKWAVAAFEDDPSEAAVVAQLTPGSGAHDDALDTVAWVAMWKRHPDALAKSPLTTAELDDAEADATELVPLIDFEETNDAHRETARRAYTHWAQLFQRLAKVGRFLGPDDVTWPGIAAPAATPKRETAPTPTPQPS